MKTQERRYVENIAIRITSANDSSLQRERPTLQTSRENTQLMISKPRSSTSHSFSNNFGSSAVKQAQSHRSCSSAVSKSRTTHFPTPQAAPPPCESIQTNSLWRRVHRAKRMSHDQVPAYMKATTASTGRTRGHLQPSTRSQSLADTVDTSLTAPTVSTSVKTRPLRVSDRTFRTEVFVRYGISITQVRDVWSPFEHFNTLDPTQEEFQGTMQEWYQRKHKNSAVWLEHDETEAERIAGQYTNLVSIRAKEAKLSYRGKNYFFKDDDVWAPTDQTRCSSTYFELEWAPNPDGNYLCSPPSMNGAGSIFSFNTNPDCTYWLPMRSMNREYANRVKSYTYVLPEPAVVAPYLTIEFKKDGMSFEAAENQLAVASALVLYNRFRLRCSRLQAYNRSGNEQLFEDIEHYGIAFNGSVATFYLSKPVLQFHTQHKSLEEAWTGCTLTKLADEDARFSWGVIRIQKWVNEIHSWGLGKHSSHFVVDIKGLLLKAKGGARISLMPEEEAILGIV